MDDNAQGADSGDVVIGGGAATLMLGDCLDRLKELADNSVDSVVTDPPYGLSDHTEKDIRECMAAWLTGKPYLHGKAGFMNRTWDSFVPGPEVWREVFRVLKPGGYVLCFASTRTDDLMSMALRLAGFRKHPFIGWTFGCLSEDTEILVDGEWVHYSKATEGKGALCYNIETDTFSSMPIERLYVYDYDETAYKITSDRTEQVVSRNHRCIVERDGGWCFVKAEGLKSEEVVPVLERLPGMLDPIQREQQWGVSQKTPLQQRVRREGLGEKEIGRGAPDADGRSGNDVDNLSSLLDAGLASKFLAEEGQESLLQQIMQGKAYVGKSADGEQVRSDGYEVPWDGVGRGEEPRVEGRGDILSEARKLQTNQIRSMPAGVYSDGEEGRVCDGASIAGCASDRSAIAENRSCAPCKPRSAGQRPVEPGTVRIERGPQALRAPRSTSPCVARVTPFHYTGKVWCVKVPTGAFVARRNGKIFVTGNSGFPKAANLGKAFDKEAGAEREVVGVSSVTGARLGSSFDDGLKGNKRTFQNDEPVINYETAPATDAAKEWDGWYYGLQSLKPAIEPCLMFQKPHEGRMTDNVLKYGTGAINVDGCRVATAPDDDIFAKNPHTHGGFGHAGAQVFGDGKGSDYKPQDGRWPANLILSYNKDEYKLRSGVTAEQRKELLKYLYENT